MIMQPRKPTEKEKQIGYAISNFYSKKFLDGGSEIEKLKIRDIIVDENGVHIYLVRPGLLIGRRGQNLKELEEHLDKKVSVYESYDWDFHLNPEPYLDF